MTVIRETAMRYTGVAADTKPASPLTNSIFFETDTGKDYYYNGAAWVGSVATLHASTHQTGGTDAIKLDDFAAPDDNTDLNASATAHGLLPKIPNNTTTWLRGDATYTTPKSIIIFPFAWNATTVSVTYVGATNLALQTSTTETNVDLIFDYALTVKAFRITVTANAKTGDSIFSFRDDAADATGVTITVPATTLGEHSATGLSAAVAAGSKINFKVDASAGGTNTLTAFGYVVAEVNVI